MNKLLGLLTLARHHARGPERPEPGTVPARFTYFTVETRDGKRCCAIDQSTNQRARTVSAAGRRLKGDAGSHEHDTE